MSIRKDQVVSLEVLTDGPVTLTCRDPQLADVAIRRLSSTDKEFAQTWQEGAGCLGVGMILLGVICVIGG